MTPTDRFARAAIDLYKLTRDDAPESFAACREFVAAEKELTGAPSAYDDNALRVQAEIFRSDADAARAAEIKTIGLWQNATGCLNPDEAQSGLLPRRVVEASFRARDAAVADLRAVAEAIGCAPNREAMVAAVASLGKWRQTVLDASDAADPYAARMGLTDAVKAIRGELLSTIVRSYDMRAKLTAAEKARDNLERSVNDLFHAIGYSGNDLDGAVHLAEEQRKAAKSASALTAANLAYGSAEGTLKATIADLRAKLAAAEQARKEAADLADHWQSVAERHNTGHESEQIRSELTRPRYEAVADRDGLLADEDDEDDEDEDPCPDCGEPAIVGHRLRSRAHMGDS